MAKRNKFSTKSDPDTQSQDTPETQNIPKKQKGLIAFIGFMGLLTFLAGVAFVSWNYVQYKFTAEGP